MPRSMITERSIHLLRELGHGRDRVFAADAKPPGAHALMQAGYAVRVGPERMELTPTGCAFLAGMARAEERNPQLTDEEAGEVHDALGMILDLQKDRAMEPSSVDIGKLQAKFRRGL